MFVSETVMMIKALSRFSPSITPLPQNHSNSTLASFLLKPDYNHLILIRMFRLYNYLLSGLRSWKPSFFPELLTTIQKKFFKQSESKAVLIPVTIGSNKPMATALQKQNQQYTDYMSKKY